MNKNIIDFPGYFYFRQADGYIANLYPEFIALISNLKPVIRTEPLALPSLKEILDITDRLGLFVTYNVNPLGENSYIAYISKDDCLALEAQSFEKKKNSIKLGEALGYPRCCINEFIKAGRSRGATEEGFLYISRLNTFKKEGRFDGLLKLGTGYHLISHFPCSYDCRPSVAYAGSILNLIIKGCKDKAWLKSLLNHLNMPVLKVNDFYYDIPSSKVEFKQSNSFNVIRHNLVPFKKASSMTVHIKLKENRAKKVSKFSLFRLFNLYDVFCKYEKRTKKQIFFATSPNNNKRYAILESDMNFFFLPFKLDKRWR